MDFAKQVAPAWIDIFTQGAATATIKTVEEGGKLLLGHSAFSQENVFVQFTNALSKLTEKQLAIAFIDDIHWADGSSLGLLFHLARNFQDRSVMFICAYRPVEGLETYTNATVFRDVHDNLLRYGAKELEIRQGINVARYVSQRYSLNTFPSDLLEQIQKLTGGHALFVSQLFSLWEDAKVIDSTPDPHGQPVWGLEQKIDAYLKIPNEIGQVLDGRIRLMEDQLRETLTYASVEGEDFTVQVVTRLRQLDEIKIFDNLETLEHRYRLIQEQESKETELRVLDFYRFAHRFFREHIYKQLSGGKRRILHRQVGECLESLYSNKQEIAGQLALHFREAHELLKAAKYALMAVQHEHTRYAWTEAENWCQFGMELIDKLPRSNETIEIRFGLLEKLGEIYYHSSDYFKAEKVYRESLNLSQQLQIDIERIVNVYDKLSDACYYQGRFQEAIILLEQGKKILIDHNVPFGKPHIDIESSLAYYDQEQFGKGDIAVDALYQVLAKAEQLPKTPKIERVISGTYNMLGILLERLGKYSESIVAYQQSLELVKKVGDKVAEIQRLLNIASHYLTIGEFEQGMTYITEGLDLSKQVGDLNSKASAHSAKGEALLGMHRPQESLTELLQGISIANSVYILLGLCRNLAISYLALSDLDKAREYAELSIKYAGDNEYDSSYGLEALAQVEAKQQNWDLATDHFNQAITIHQKAGAQRNVARFKTHFAEMLIQQGKQEQAIELLQTALMIFQTLALTHEITRTKNILDTMVR